MSDVQDETPTENLSRSRGPRTRRPVPVNEPTELPTTTPVPPVYPQGHEHQQHPDRKNFELDTSSKTILVVLAILTALFLVFTAGVVTGSRVGYNHDNDRGYNIQAPNTPDRDNGQQG